jgi:hypothetical protein
MPLRIVFALIAAISQANTEPSKPSILQMRYGLAGKQFTGHAAGWPFRPGHWNWLTATVNNPFDRDLDAALTFHTLTPTMTGRFAVSKRFNLPAQSALRVSFPVRSPTFNVPTRQSSYGVLELKVDGEITDEKRAEITSVPENIYGLGVLGEANGLQGALDAVPLYVGRGPELQSPGFIRSVTLVDEKIPENVLGLDFLHTLIIVHPSDHELRPAQWAAVDEWVQTGGNLVFVLGTDSAAHEVPDIRPMLPAYPVGTRRVTVLPALAEWSGESLKFEEGFELAEMVAVSGLVIVSDGQMPLVVQSQRGAGKVSCVAVDVERGLADQRAYKQFWLEVLRHLHVPLWVDTERIEPFAGAIVEQFAGRQIVGVWLPVTVLGAYFVVIWLLVRVARRGRLVETRWISVCAAAIAFAGTSYALAWATAPAPTQEVFDIWVAKGASPSQILSLTDYLSILPSSHGDSSVRINDGRVQLVPACETGATVVDSAIDHKGSTVRYQSKKAQLRTFHLEGPIIVPGLRARVSTGPQAVTIEFENQSSYDLDNSFFKLGRRTLPVGRLARSERKILEVESDTSADSYESNPVLDSASRLRHSILRTLFVDPAMQSDEQVLAIVHRGAEQGTSSGSLFAGWVNQSPLDVSWDDSTGATTLHALGLLAIEPEWVKSETHFLVPRGGMSMEFRDQGARQFHFGKSVFRGYRPVPLSLAIDFSLPSWAQPAKIEQATLFVEFVADAYRLVIKVGDKQLSLPEVPSGRFSLPASAVASQSGGPISLQLVVEPRAEFTRDMVKQGYRWELRHIELECRCRKVFDEHD